MIDLSARRQFVRYAIVGFTSNLLIYSAYLGLSIVGFGHKLAMTVVYVVGVLLTFMANRMWSFNHRSEAHATFVRYVIVYILGYFLNLCLLWVGVDYLHFPHQGVQALSILLVAVTLFLLHKFWVFTNLGVQRGMV